MVSSKDIMKLTTNIYFTCFLDIAGHLESEECINEVDKNGLRRESSDSNEVNVTQVAYIHPLFHLNYALFTP